MSSSPQPFFDLLSGRSRVLLTGHEHPDGDCLGSQVALFHLLDALGKDVRICNPDPPPRSLDFLQRHTPIDSYPGGALPQVDLVVLLDCARLDRLGTLANAIRDLDVPIAVVDHHVGSDHGDGDVAFVDVAAAATGVLAHALWKHSERELTPPAAEGVFVALTADTGWFRYSNTSAEVLLLAAELTRAGVNPSTVYDLIHRRNEPDSVAVLADGISRGRVTLGGALGMLPVDRALIDRANRAGVDLDLLMEPLRSVAGVEVVAMLKEVDGGRVKLSLRSQRNLDVQAIARGFGGGGHRKAAGATLPFGLEAAERAVEHAVRQALGEGG